jgi:hypothetical protein
MLMAFVLVAEMNLQMQGIDVSEARRAPDSVDLAQWFKFLAKSSATLVAVLVAVFAATHFDALPQFVRRHSLLLLHVLVWLALALSTLPNLGMLIVAPLFLWRASYMLKAAAARNGSRTSLRDHLFYMLPVYGGTNTPYGKGSDYLSKCEALDPESLARSHLAGIKLLVLAAIWTAVLAIMDTLLFGSTSTFLESSLVPWSLQLTPMADLMQVESNRTMIASWFSVYLELIRATLVLAISGHVIIGCLRLLGFNVFRNTYKPLLSESIVDFWNRYYFYFKEIMADFFFYPTYFRCNRAGPKLRLFLAVFAAAFVGNVYYHLLIRAGLLVEGDLLALWQHWGPRLVYCFFLAFGIWVSMLRQQLRRSLGTPVTRISRLRAIAGVWTFYGLIHIWNIQPGKIAWAERWSFQLSLVGF